MIDLFCWGVILFRHQPVVIEADVFFKHGATKKDVEKLESEVSVVQEGALEVIIGTDFHHI